MATENIMLLGFVLLIIAIFVIIIGAIMSGGEKIKFAFGGFIGPLPFGFANDPKMLWVVIVISAVILLFFILSWITHII